MDPRTTPTFFYFLNICKKNHNDHFYITKKTQKNNKKNLSRLSKKIILHHQSVNPVSMETHDKLFFYKKGLNCGFGE